MAKKKVRPEALELYKKMLVIFSCVAVALTFLLGNSSFLMLVVALVLALLPAFLWKFSAARLPIRVIEVLWLAAPFILWIVLLAIGSFHTEYFSVLLPFAQLILPSTALAARQNGRFDVWLVRIAGFAHVLLSALYIAYVLPLSGWVEILLFAAMALVILVLPFLAFPADFSRFKKKE